MPNYSRFSASVFYVIQIVEIIFAFQTLKDKRRTLKLSHGFCETWHCLAVIDLLLLSSGRVCVLKSIPIMCFNDQSSGLFLIIAKETYVFYGGLKSPNHSTFGCVPILCTRIIIDVCFLITYFQYFFFYIFNSLWFQLDSGVSLLLLLLLLGLVSLSLVSVSVFVFLIIII